MKRILSAFSTFGWFLVGLVSKDTAAKAEAGLKAIAPYFSKALEVVEVIAAMTPNRTDDEILALIRAYAVPVVLGDNADRGTVLRDIALQMLRRNFPGVADRQLNRTIEVALGTVKP